MPSAVDRHHGAGREVGGDPDDGGRVDSGVGDRGGDGVAQDVAVVVGHLERPFAGEPDAGAARRVRRKLVGDHGMRVVEDSAAEFLAVADPDDDGPPGERAVVHADDKVFGSVH